MKLTKCNCIVIPMGNEEKANGTHMLILQQKERSRSMENIMMNTQLLLQWLMT